MDDDRRPTRRGSLASENSIRTGVDDCALTDDAGDLPNGAWYATNCSYTLGYGDTPPVPNTISLQWLNANTLSVSFRPSGPNTRPVAPRFYHRCYPDPRRRDTYHLNAPRDRAAELHLLYTGLRNYALATGGHFVVTPSRGALCQTTEFCSSYPEAHDCYRLSKPGFTHTYCYATVRNADGRCEHTYTVDVATDQVETDALSHDCPTPRPPR